MSTPPSIPWGPWRPDVTVPNSGFCQIADSVLPISGGLGQYGAQLISYGPFPQLVAPANAGALSAAPRGSISLTLNDGTNQVYYATASTIEQLQSGFTFSAIDTGRTVTAGDDVSFLHFGAFLLNTDTTDGFKAYNVQTPAGNNAVVGAPTARFLFTCNNVVFALDCNGNNKAWQSSALGDHTEWVLGGANGGVFPDGEALIAGVDLKNGNGLIFQKNAMRLIQFGNAVTPALYSIVKASDGRGSVGERSVVPLDGTVYFLDTDGFYKFDLSNGNTAIGAEKINRWFLSQIDNSRLSEVQGSLDPKNKIVCWRFPSITNPSQTVFDRMICYDWQLNEWFTLTVDTSSLARIATPGYVLDAMDVFGTLDGMNQIPLDDRFWQGGAPVFAALNSSFIFSTFSGSPMAATLQSYMSDAPQATMMRMAKPISDDISSTVQIGTQFALSDSTIWRPAVGRGRAGKVPVRGVGTNVAFQENHPASATWTYANGIDYPAAGASGAV